MSLYIFKLTPNKNSVILNSSVLETGKYSTVKYPVKTINMTGKKYLVDKDTYKFVDSDDYNMFSEPYPISLEINGEFEDILFYATNNKIGNIDIDFIYNITIKDNLYYNITGSKNDIPFNLSIIPVWNDSDKHTFNSDDILSFTFNINKFENISKDNNTYISNFEDFDLFKSLSTNIDNILNTYSNNSKISGTLITSNKTVSGTINHVFRDSLYMNKRQIGEITISATYTRTKTGMSVSNMKTFPIYQNAYTGAKVTYYNLKICDYTNPIELWSPTVTFNYGHNIEANPKVDIDTVNIIDTIKISGEFKPNPLSKEYKDITYNSYITDYDQGIIYGIDSSTIKYISDGVRNQLIYAEDVRVKPYYFDTTINQYNTKDTDVNTFVNAVNNCITLSTNMADKKNYLFVNNYISNIADDLKVSSQLNIVSTATSVKYTDKIFFATYAKYYFDLNGYHQLLPESNTSNVYAVTDTSNNLNYTVYNTNHSGIPGKTININTYKDAITNYKIGNYSNDTSVSSITQYMYCVNNPFTELSVLAPIYASFAVLQGYVPIYDYAYDFTQESDIIVNSNSIDLTAYDNILTRDSDTNLHINISSDIKKYILSLTIVSNIKYSPKNNTSIKIPVTYGLYKASTYTYNISIQGDAKALSYININGGLQILNGSNTTLTASTNISPYIFSISLKDTSVYNSYVLDVIFNENKNTNIRNSKLVITNDEDEKHLHNFKYEGKDINNNLESYMLLRTNPKLSGNIKLIVDSDYNLYLDTFKSSDILNNSNYRKFPISAEGNYPRDIRNVFKTLPISELYKTSENSLNAHKIYTDYKDQYETMYEYGAETNTDVLYSENMKILAPLHIGKNIPEFFAIFRYDGVYNEETYNNIGFNDINKFKSLIKDSSIVTTIDLRQYTSIGLYLNNYKTMLLKYGYGQCELLFIELDNYVNSEQYRQGKNIWKGILVKSGILAEQSETSYFANKILNDSLLKNKQEQFNNYILSGFERHGLLYPNIINLEFMFNDNENDEYTMHRYFGLYLYENDFINYGYITDIKNGNNNVLLKYDINGELYIGDNLIYKNIFNDKYKDRIFYAITNNNAIRVQTETDVNTFLTDNIKNQPEYNITEISAEKLLFNNNLKSFITLHINKEILYGEHIKFILMNVQDKHSAYILNNSNSNNIISKHYIYEIIASNDNRLRYAENNISPYITTHICEYNNSVIFKRISFYTQDTLYPDVPANISDLIKRIVACINKFNKESNTQILEISYYNHNTISVISTHTETYLQHIAAPDLTSFKYDYMHIKGINNKLLHICTTNTDNIDSLLYLSDDISTNITLDTILQDSKYIYISETDKDNNYKYYSYIETNDPDNIKQDNISYYNKEIVYNMKAMSNVTEFYDSYYIPFSNYMFESLGWRHNTIVKFIVPEVIPNMYILHNDITEHIKNINNPIVFNTNNMYETLYKFNINSGYLSNNIVNPLLWAAYCNKTQEFKFNNITNILITNPFNSNYNILCSNSDILLQNDVIRLYKPKSALIAVMGISNIKDIDTNVETLTEIHRESKLYASFKENEVIQLNESDIRILHAVMYEIIKGTLVNNTYKLLQGDKFIIIPENGITIYKETGLTVIVNTLTAKTDTIIKICDKQKYQEYNYSTNIPEIKLSHFFKDINDINNSDLNYPIVPLVNCAWKSTGLYIDDNNVIDTSCMSKDYELKYGHFTESVFTPDLFEPNQYVLNKINNILYVDNSPTTFKYCILNKSLTHSIKKLLIDNVNINTAVCHYNSNIYSLEFIYFGIKFVIKFNDKLTNTYLHLDSYNNYNVFILNEYDSSKTNELYISEYDEFILLINHQFYIDYAREADSNIKDITINNYKGYAPYSTYKAGINVDFLTLTVSNANSDVLSGYLSYNKHDILNNIDVYNLWSSWFIQEGNENYMYSPLENIMTNDNYISFINYSIGDKFYNSILSDNDDVNFAYIMTKADGDYNTLITSLLSNINGSSNITDIENIVNTPVFNILNELNYSDKILSTDSANALLQFAKQILRNETIKEKQERYIKSVTDNIDIYIIPENELYKYILNTEEYNPLMFNLTIPNYIKYNYGHFTPNTNNMVEYNIDDLELGTLIDVDLLCANTNISDVYKLHNYTGNKVYETSNKKVNLNYFTVPERSLFSSTWDNGYYRLYLSESSYIPYDGLLTGIDDKSFFGSRCMIIKHPYLELNTWIYHTTNDLYITKIVDSEYNVNAENTKCLLLDINLSKVIYHYFINNKNFTDNWKPFKDALYTGMKNYINYTMYAFYNLNSDIDLTLYKLDTDPLQSINIIEKNDMNITYSIYENYKSNITFTNNEYILSIIINDISGMDIHPVLKIYRK